MIRSTTIASVLTATLGCTMLLNTPVQANASDSDRIIKIPATSVVLNLWEEQSPNGSTTMYSISKDNGEHFTEPRMADYTLMLRYASFDPLTDSPLTPVNLTAGPENEIYIVQFVTQPLAAFRDDIEQAGGTIYKYLANDSYIVRMNSETVQTVQNLSYVRWVGDYQPAYRLALEVLNTWFSSDGEQLQSSEEAIFNIQVFERGPHQKQIIADRIADLGGRVDHLIPDGFLLRATLTPDQLNQILHMNEVLFVDPWYPPEVDMDIAREIQGVNYVENQTGFTGQGVRGEVFDTGIRITHDDWQNPRPIIHKSNSTDTWHGSSTHGIVFGDGSGNSTGRGMLPDAEQSITSSFYYLSNRYTHTAELVDPSGDYRAVFQSNSWGGGRTFNYTSESMEMDDILLINDILITQSQSNAGNQDSRPQAWAKNIVAVGGVYHYNTSTKSDDRWNYGGSIGPAADGRIKPDLTNFYDDIYTTTDSCNNCYTSSFGGTSGATPIVAGHFGLVFQMWHEGVFPGRGGGATVFDSRPHMSTAKAIVINTAEPYPFPPETDMSRFRQGWGMPDLISLLDTSENMFIVDEEDLLENLDSVSYQITVDPGTPELRATMVYTDVAGTTSSSQHRINDLTMKVTSPSSDIYWGNYGLEDDVWSVAGGSADTKNTVENVFIENPESGQWLVEIIGDEIVEDSHTETGAVDADFALVISGALGEPGMHLDVDDLFAGQPATLTVTNATPSQTVYFIYSIQGEGSTYVPALDVTLNLDSPRLSGSATANAEGTAVYEGQVPQIPTPQLVWIQAAEYQNTTNVVLKQIN